jgi:hypothetical protein
LRQSSLFLLFAQIQITDNACNTPCSL